MVDHVNVFLLAVPSALGAIWGVVQILEKVVNLGLNRITSRFARPSAARPMTGTASSISV
jgi:hypothetical protein